MARKHYQMDEVIRNLTSKKGCIITTKLSITKQIQNFELPDQEKISKYYLRFLKDQDSNINLKIIEVGIEKAVEYFFSMFQKDYPSLFENKMFYSTYTIQAPYVVNIQQAHDLGNGSWGKIDFLTNHCGFSVKRA